MYYTYMLRCNDNSLYTGITTDLNRRFNEHKIKNKKCAKYTLLHTVTKIECAWQSNTKSEASKLEYNIKKHLNKTQKEKLINGTLDLNTLFNFDCSIYKKHIFLKNEVNL